MTTTASPDPTTTNAGRDSNGRFTKGNPGGPGNPYYRRQAELKRGMLDFVTDVDVNSVVRVLLGLARGGDLAAIKLFLEYTIGKPNDTVDPDKVDLHEWQIEKQTPKLVEVTELMATGVEPELASMATRDMANIVGACHIGAIGRQLMSGVDSNGEQVIPPLGEDGADTDRKPSKRRSASARKMSAGVHSTDQTGDNSGESDAWTEEEAARTVPTGEIGNLIDMLQRLQKGGSGQDP